MLNYYYSSYGRLPEIGYTKDSSRPDALEDHYTILRNAMGDVAGLLKQTHCHTCNEEHEFI